ncbi:hypothetical protein BVRB_2g030220 [Beta vulgaris subsp. vulgaris]|uniref:uncharacterized protein LOC104908655 n=1 Tax=Beta vulgaris subsp. vulgaris TaxID=3555 RepID=UPI00053FEB98|nr:uncharacterized protein LOC104908655 [Beta vulgaris subsp. vulgaris]XP_010696100.1 uncharacterized protein LOC104908655 [Beta vulgaris subsp. vulgaris]XP_010696104.1 uncharacterized protein LOC104908655 [Beta vulgaris subsp. vulgaris]XP_048495229.1 uncharacterized protein LOC104908655 [Beta vulgaris subsp. vulgaris]XP_048495230.1 uncharacterized protein LOC104908655 [Beta vulgaris subsp. vulgaris]XP_048495231.1 uncharacterized protein LOC104908655 [Beta vulgaris subsp. vulgaris]XP_05724870
MVSSRLAQALSKCKIVRNDAMFRNTRNVSTSILPNVSKQDPSCRVANIGRNQSGLADAVIQIDGSWHKKSMTGGAAWIMKDEHLQKIYGGCLHANGVSALHMEVLGCLHGIKWAITHRFHNVSIYTKSRDLVQLLQGSTPLDITLLWPIQEIKYQALLLNWCCVHRVSRSEIHHAHNAAIACRAGLLSPCSSF